ncbi:sensor histidine kinase [Botryobacter ruber]|uniref:sensor histidine kinase n=1 Tax=Botryobacter ruber TaxID=2171629 RepID=UPI000E0C3460|nr:HAMP domain-containing sensor histidine kinase [Botryobacter ruber]
MATAAVHYHLPAFQARSRPDAAVKDISKQINASVAAAQSEAVAIGKKLGSDSVSFSKLLRLAHCPTFIYRHNELIFWSDHTIIPDLDYPPDVTHPVAVSNTYGTFIVVPHIASGYNIFLYIPLQNEYRIRNSFLSPGLEQRIFGKTNARLVLTKRKGLPQVRTSDNKFLFALDFGENKTDAGQAALELILFSGGVIFYILFCILWSRRLLKQGKYNEGIILLLALLAALRLAMLQLNLPFALKEVELFDPKVYAASYWSPSVGDLALNMLLLTTVAWASFYLFQKNKVMGQLKVLPRQKIRYILAGCFLSFFMLLVVLFKFYHGIYHNSPLVLDISQSLDLTRYKLVIYGIMFLHTAALGVFTFILATVVRVLLQQEELLWPYKVVGAIALALLVLAGVLDLEYISVVLIGSFFWLLIIISAQHPGAINFPYRTYLFIFLIISVSAATGASAIYTHYQSELKAYKQKFGYTIMQDSDVLGEFLLDSVAMKIASDALIRSKMKGPYVDASFIKRKISKQYLRHYFDKYETSVYLFDSKGMALESADTSRASLHELMAQYDKPVNRTEHKDLFLINDPMRYNTRMYLKVIEVPLDTWQKGTIILQLRLKKLLPNSLVPELLVDQGSNQPFRTDRMSYAFFENGQLKYSEGEYDYATNFSRSLLNRWELERDGIRHEGYHHLGIVDDNGQVLIITTENYGSKELLSNFSFLFLVFTAGAILCTLLLLLLQRRYIQNNSLNFSTKIQLFLNFGILLPLVLVSIITAGLVTASYRKDLMRSYENRGEAIQQNLSTLLTRNVMQRKNLLLKYVTDIASVAEADINVYDQDGRLLVTSQPLIFEAGLLSKLVNPQAFAAISERQALRVLLNEHAGSLTFNSIYLPLRDSESSGQIAGFIGIPFFDSEKQLEIKLIELITTTMNIFTVMFIMFMVLTFFASRALTVPLRMLANKLKRTSLTGKNEMLAYEGADEIGMLVNEYNRMLLTLEQNKVDLATREKEAAWREMARQVAHEIKNPLTPMKLSLQYLQKAISEKRPNTEQLIDKISHTLITQINILSDIATSFSNFTAMPEPKAELMDVAAALRKSVDLHNDPASVSVKADFEREEVFITADEGLMVRTFNNLLLNAIQAVPANRKPKIHVTLHVQPDETVLISIRDNGVGIPDEIQSKVFIPNFSTKYTGSGIGLAVAKRGIENAGGRIWFETEEGKGTTFFIALPLSKP